MNWDILVVDESHEGVDTFKTTVAFKRIMRNETIYLSGTPFKQIASDRFPKEAIFNKLNVNNKSDNKLEIVPENKALNPEAKENWGWEPTTAYGIQSVAIGGSCTAYGDWSFAGGKGSKTYQRGSIALGGGTTAGDPNGPPGNGSYAVALGDTTTARGYSSLSLGNGSQALGYASLAGGSGFSTVGEKG
jgi:hypothetical protein